MKRITTFIHNNNKLYNHLFYFLSFACLHDNRKRISHHSLHFSKFALTSVWTRPLIRFESKEWLILLKERKGIMNRCDNYKKIFYFKKITRNKFLMFRCPFDQANCCCYLYNIGFLFSPSVPNTKPAVDYSKLAQLMNMTIIKFITHMNFLHPKISFIIIKMISNCGLVCRIFLMMSIPL